MYQGKRALQAIVAILGAIVVMAGFAPAVAGQDVGAEIAGGSGAVWTADQVDVLLFTDAYWTPIALQTVKDARQALPPKGPRLNVRHMGERDCDWVRKQDYRQATITICGVPDANYAGVTQLHTSHHIVQNERATVVLVGPLYGYDYDVNTACHEMMHALSWMNDNYAYPHADSCVQGPLPSFGAWDVKFLAMAYQKHDTKADNKRENDRNGHQRGNGRRGGKHGGKRGN